MEVDAFVMLQYLTNQICWEHLQKRFLYGLDGQIGLNNFLIHYINN